jgi:hypothetical protein
VPFLDTKTVPRVTNWSLKHDECSLENHLTPSAKLLWHWLVDNSKKGVGFGELEPDLQKEFNNWVAKHRGKPFDPKTIKSAIKQLISCSLITVLRKFSCK